MGAVAGDGNTKGSVEAPGKGDLARAEVDASDVVVSVIGDEDQGPVWGEGHTAWILEPGVGKGGGDFVGLEVDEGDVVAA